MFIRLIKAISNAIVWSFTKIFNVIIRFINFLHLWLILAYLAVCGIIQLASGIFSGDKYFVLFVIGFAVCFAITCYSFIWQSKKKDRAEKGDGRKESRAERRRDTGSEKPLKKKGKSHKYVEKKIEPNGEFTYPLYYRVENNEDFLVAEFEDRYELFIETEGKFNLVRTDYKTDFYS